MFRLLSDDCIVLFFKVQRHLPASLFDAFLGHGKILRVFLYPYVLPFLHDSRYAGRTAAHRIV